MYTGAAAVAEREPRGSPRGAAITRPAWSNKKVLSPGGNLVLPLVRGRAAPVAVAQHDGHAEPAPHVAIGAVAAVAERVELVPTSALARACASTGTASQRASRTHARSRCAFPTPNREDVPHQHRRQGAAAQPGSFASNEPRRRASRACAGRLARANERLLH